jgi:hypothetical protein
MCNFEFSIKINRGALMGQQQHVGIIMEGRQVLHILCVHISQIYLSDWFYLDASA